VVYTNIMRALLVVFAVGCSHHSADIAGTDASLDASSTPGVIAVPLEGCSWSFTGTFLVGGTTSSLLVDTGSSLLAVASATCATCLADGVLAKYTPSATAVDDDQMFTATYDGGDMSWTGEEYQDTVAVGGTTVSMSLYAITSEQNFFSAGECGGAEGILGMQGDGLTSLPSTFATAGITDEFAMHECRSAGTLWLGGYDPASITAPPTYVAMPDDFDAQLTDIAVGGTSIGMPASSYGEAIIDSGGPSIIVPQAAYDAITSAVAASSTFATTFGDATWFDKQSCVADPPLTKAQLDAALPTLSVQLDTTTVAMAATDSYLMTIAQDGHTYFCPALETQPSFLDLGNSLIRSHVVIFDRVHRQLGIATAPPCV
jgi:hypothetical protein